MRKIEKLKGALKSKDGKVLASNFISLSLLKVASFVFPLITLPYLTKVIGADRFGAIAFAAAIMVFIETITDWGFNYTATRDVAQNRDNKSIVSQIFSEVTCAKLLLMAICFLLLLVCIELIPALSNYKLLLILTFLYIPGHILFPEWLFQAYEKMKYITILNIISKLIFTLLIFVVIEEKDDYIYQPLLIACGYFVSGIFAFKIIFKTFKLKLILPTFECVRNRIKLSTDMFLSLLLPNLYTNFSTILLKSYYGDTATGIYSGGQKFQSIIDQLTQTLSRTFFPFLSRNKNKHYLYVRISLVISLCACLLMYFGADLFVRLFLTSEFKEAVLVIKIFSISPFFLFLMNTYGTNYLVIIGHEKILRNIILICSILGCVLTWIMTPLYSYIGVSVTVVIVWGVRGILTYIFARKKKNNDKDINCR